MRHPTLGELLPLKERPQAVRGHLQYQGRVIDIDIEPDDKSLDEAIALAGEIARSLDALDSRAKALITRDLLPAYNDGWAQRQPKLAPQDFQDRFRLNAISICGSTAVDLWYDAGHLFEGHGVYVSSFEGANMRNARAQLFG